MNLPTYSHHQDYDEYHETAMGGFNVNHDEEFVVAPQGVGEDDMMSSSMADAALMPPPPSNLLDVNKTDPEEDENDEEEEEGSEQGETMQEAGMDAPWSENWKEVVGQRLNDALAEYKIQVQSLYAAIDTFLEESNEVHKQWDKIKKAEVAESQRLDEVEPDVVKATKGVDAEEMYDRGFSGNHLDSTINS